MCSPMTHALKSTHVPAAARWLARLAVLCGAAAVVLLLAADVRAVGVVLLAVAAVALTFGGLWLFLSNRGPLRWLGATIAVLAPLALLALYASRGILWAVLLVIALLVAAVAAGRAAARARFAAHPSALPTPETVTPRPQRAFLIMNPRSGGGKVTKFDLAGKAAALHAEVTLLDGPERLDVDELARQAVADHADLLGVAGGDGTQALVAAVAAEHDVPFLVLSAGTRNHFALDLGLDRENPAAGLDALTDGVELHIDLGSINGRTFVNNASFGVYAAVVQSPAYRNDKIRTTLDMLPELLTRQRGPVVRVQAGDLRVSGPHAVLVSN